VQRDQERISIIYADHCHRSIADIESGKHVDVDIGVICHHSLYWVLMTNNDYSAVCVVASNLFHPADEASLHLKDIFSARNLSAVAKYIESLPAEIHLYLLKLFPSPFSVIVFGDSFGDLDREVRALRDGLCSLDGPLNWPTVRVFYGNAEKSPRQLLRLPAS